MSAIGIGIGAAQGVLGMALQKGQDRRQMEQQRQLQNLQMHGAKEMSEFEREQQMKMWNDTNYGAQKKHMIDAGLNPGLMYGMSGGGGTTTGGGSGAMPTSASAEAPSAGVENLMGMAMMKSQIRVMESQAKKNEAEAEATSGVKTEQAAEQTRGQKFDNDVKESIGMDKLVGREIAEIEKNDATTRKERMLVESWESVMHATDSGKRTEHTSEESRIYKTLKNEYEKAKSELNLSKAEEVIKAWSTELINDGMPPDSPWYYKLIERFINNASGGKWNLNDLGKEVGKAVIK